LVLGRTPLVERRDGRFVARDQSEIECLLSRAYRSALPLQRLMRGLANAASALNANDPCLARIAAVHLRIPDLPDQTVRDDLEAADVLIKSGDWNPALHPRTGTPPNPGWFAPTRGSSEHPAQARTAQNAQENPPPLIPAADNQRENKQVTDVVVKLGLNKAQRQELHRAISGMGYNYHDILEIAKDMFGK
jgi:hypothetical protein